MSNLPEVRIGNAEREDALAALSRHLSDGRLTVSEFDDRSAAIASATTRGELEPLFADLPSTPVTLAAPAAVSAPLAPAQSSVPAEEGDGIDWRALVMPIVVIGSLALFFVTDFAQNWLFFLLVPLVGAILSATGGVTTKKNKKTH